MADKLFYRTQVGITPGTPATLAHGLSANGVAVAPDQVTAFPIGSRRAAMTGGCVIVSQNAASVYVDILGEVAATVDVVAMYWHSIQRAT